MTNPLRMLQEYGQSVWLDFLSRDLFRSGELKRLIAEDGLRGMTSNPSIFEKAIGHGEDYDAQIAELEAAGDLDPGALFERLAITDIQKAADVLRPVYDQTQGRDGYVSIEVSPYLAMQTDATIDEARRLWREAGRDKGVFRIAAEIVREADREQLHLSCEDNGVGIPKDNLERVFDQGFTTKSHDTNHGIGLHWCANAIAALGGRIWAASEGRGHGASLHMMLPLALSNAATITS